MQATVAGARVVASAPARLMADPAGPVADQVATVVAAVEQAGRTRGIGAARWRPARSADRLRPDAAATVAALRDCCAPPPGSTLVQVLTDAKDDSVNCARPRARNRKSCCRIKWHVGTGLRVGNLRTAPSLVPHSGKYPHT